MGLEDRMEKIGEAKKVLITGHTGFKGTWLSLMLKKAGHYVVGISLPPTPESLSLMLNERFVDEEYFIDVRDEKSIIDSIIGVDPNYIFHLAAQPLVRDSYLEPLNTFKTNVLGTANVLEAASRCPNLLSVGVITTDKVYLNKSEKIRYSENSPLGGSDPYSASKAASEMAVMAWRSLHHFNGRNNAKIFSLRAGNVIGGGDFAKDRLIPDIVRALDSSSALKIRNPKSTRPWQHVLDPLDGYIRALMTANYTEEFDFNFGPEESAMTVEEVVIQVRRFWPELNVITEKTIDEGEMAESNFLEIDSSKAEKLLNWKPKWNQIDSIKQTVIWWDKVRSNRLTPIEACQRDLQSFYS